MVYIKLFPGCIKPSQSILELEKSLYSLKQSSHSFHNFLTAESLDYGFEQCLTGACVSRMVDSQDPTEGKMILLCYVNDRMVADSSSDTDKVSAYFNGSLKPNLGGGDFLTTVVVRSSGTGKREHSLMHQESCIEAMVGKLE